MRHGKRFPPQMNRKPHQRDILISSLVTSLIMHGKIETTAARAKVAARQAEQVIGWAKKGLRRPNVERSVFWSRTSEFLQDPEKTMPKLFDVIAPRYRLRDAGFTRITLHGKRLRDNASMAIVQLVDGERDLKFDMTAKVIGKQLGEIAAGEHLFSLGSATALDHTRKVNPRDRELAWKWRTSPRPSLAPSEAQAEAQQNVISDKDQHDNTTIIPSFFKVFIEKVTPSLSSSPSSSSSTSSSTSSSSSSLSSSPSTTETQTTTSDIENEPVSVYQAAKDLYGNLPIDPKTKKQAIQLFKFRETEPIYAESEKHVQIQQEEDILAHFDSVARDQFDETLVRLGHLPPTSKVTSESTNNVITVDSESSPTVQNYLKRESRMPKYSSLSTIGVVHGKSYGNTYTPARPLEWIRQREERLGNVSRHKGLYVPTDKDYDVNKSKVDPSSRYTIPHWFKHTVWQQSLGSLGLRKNHKDDPNLKDRKRRQQRQQISAQFHQ